MNMIEHHKRPESFIRQLVDLWEASVKATHHFLSDADIAAIKLYVPQALAQVPHLITLNDEHNRPLAFMGIDNDRLEMLFVHPDERGKGLGKKLLTQGIENYAVRQLTVNEQNPQAVAFYRHMGFHTVKRTDTDEQGNPYPLLYMKLGQQD